MEDERKNRNFNTEYTASETSPGPWWDNDQIDGK